MTKKKHSLLARTAKPAVFVLCLVPFLALLFSAFTGRLGANPIEVITHETGETALRLLLLTLCLTPLRKLTGWNSVIRFRRMLGLYAFFYASVHLFIYVGLDAVFDPAYIWEDIAERLYITAGFFAFCLLVPLALTSTNAMIKRLGAQRWQRLHRLAYAATALGVLHFLWLVKADMREPLVYLLVLIVLLGCRIPIISSRLSNFRSRSSHTART